MKLIAQNILKRSFSKTPFILTPRIKMHKVVGHQSFKPQDIDKGGWGIINIKGLCADTKILVLELKSNNSINIKHCCSKTISCFNKNCFTVKQKEDSVLSFQKMTRKDAHIADIRYEKYKEDIAEIDLDMKQSDRTMDD